MKIATTAEMRRLEQAAVDAGATWPGLMEQAGWGVAQAAIRLLRSVAGRRVLVLVGPGNNGGDGLVATRHLHDAGALVTLYLWARQDPDQDTNWRRCRERAIPEVVAEQDPNGSRLRALLADSELVIDALLGMGASRPVEGQLAAIIALVNSRPRPAVLAIDLPTGVHSDSGAILGNAIQADLTVATGLPKRGLLYEPGRSCAGTIELAEIDLPAAALDTVRCDLLDAGLARSLLPPRPADSHKGTFGRLLVVAGSSQYPGAAVLATTAGYRVGAGLVTLATGRSALLAARPPEVTLRLLSESPAGGLNPDAAGDLLTRGADYTALVIGPGLGREGQTGMFLRRLLGLEQRRPRGRVGFVGAGGVTADTPDAGTLPPMVIDADGLNLLSEIDSWHRSLPPGQAVLTPHPGEMRRLLQRDQLAPDHAGVVQEAAERWGQVVVLKGATTAVGLPDGRTILHAGANPALATAGTGDVLAGAIGGLLAQGLPLEHAALLGVYLHARAGQLVRAELGDAGAMAGDLLGKLPLTIRALRESESG